MKNCRIIGFVLVFIVGFSVVKAQEKKDSLAENIDEYLLSAHKFDRFNGSALIAEKGRILLQKGYGYKNVATGVPNDSNTIYQIGSVTKQFTAAVILKLQEEGKLSVNDKLSKYFPEFTYADQITLNNLLTHTSGIYNYTNDIDENDSAIVCNPVSKQLVLDLIFKKNLDFVPGTRFSYDNSGYYLLGLIIEKVTGKSYESEVRDIIFNPLGMNHSFFDFRDAKDTNLATGYKKLNAHEQIIAQRWDSTVTYAAGGIFSTTGDMYRWATAVARKTVLSAGSWDAATTPHLEHYGYGWFIDTIYGERSISHGGGLPGYLADLTYFPDKDATIILLNNEGYYGEGLTDISASIAAILFHQPYELMHVRTEMMLPDTVLRKYAGEYVFDKKHHVFITLQNGSLQMAAPAGNLPKSPLFPQDEINFFLKIIDARIEFTFDANKNITGFVSHYNGKNEVCKKVK